MNEIYASKHQLNAVQARLVFFYNLSFNIPSIFDEIERLKHMEEALIYQVRSDEKKCGT
jgi:hypothetical protein